MSLSDLADSFLSTLRNGKGEEGLSKAIEIIKKFPAASDFLVERAKASELVVIGEILIHCHHYSVAAMVLDPKRVPVDSRARAYYLRAFCQKASGNFRGAASDLLFSARLNKDPSLAFEAVLCLIDGNEVSKASRLLKRTIGPKKSLQTQHLQALSRYCSGRLFYALGRFSDAQRHFLSSIEVDPSFRPAAQWLMLTTAVTGQIDVSIELFDQLRKNSWLTPDFFESLINRLTGRGLGALAIQLFERLDDPSLKTLAASHTIVEALRSVGNNLRAVEMIRDLKERGEWIESLPFLLSEAHALGTLGDVKEKEGIERRIVDLVSRDPESVVNPWLLFSFADAPDLFIEMARKYSRSLYGGDPASVPSVAVVRSSSLKSGHLPRIAFMGADYIRHPVAFCLEPLIRELSGEIETVLLSLSPRRDHVTQSLAGSADRFFDLSGADFYEIKKVVESEGIDILFDTSVFTAGGRPELIQKRLAPSQVNFLGFSGSSGMSGYDFIVGDAFIFGSGLENKVSEAPAILRVPLLSMMLSEGKVGEGERATFRHDLGLSDDHVLFCSLAKPYKINMKLLEAWATILDSVPDSFILLPGESSSFIRGYLIENGISDARILLSERLNDRRDHLVRLSAADLFLDVFPYNAHSLAADALSAAVPVLSLVGDSFAARVSGSLVAGLGQDDLLCYSLDEYIRKAIALGSEKQSLIGSRDQLRSSISSRNWSTEYADSFVQMVVDSLLSS